MNAAPAPHAAAAPPDYRRPFAVVTTLFFMWGFLTALNDILIPHLKAVFDLTYVQAALVQFTFFGAYFLMAIPAERLIARLGYQGAMVAGLLVAASARRSSSRRRRWRSTPSFSARFSSSPPASPSCKRRPTRTSPPSARPRGRRAA